MERQTIARQLLSFHKATFDNTLSTLTALQEQTEKMVTLFLDSVSSLPPEGQAVIREWADSYRMGRADFQARSEESYRKVEDFFSRLENGSGRSEP